MLLVKDIPQISLGPPEALHAELEAEERLERKNMTHIVDHHYETYLFAMAQMPGEDNKTGPGFQDAARWLLGDRISPKASSLIHESGWSLHKLLTATDEDLQSTGIAFQQDRENILCAVRDFHCASWKTLQTIKLKPDTSQKNHKGQIIYLLEQFSRLVQQLYTDTATIAWLRQRIPKKEEDKEKLRKLVSDTMVVTAILIKLSEEVYKHTKKVNKHIPKHPIDFIDAKDKKANPFYMKILKFSIVIGSVTFILPQIEAKVYPTSLHSFSKLTIKCCLLAAWMLY